MENKKVLSALVFAVIGIAFVPLGSFDATVIVHCKERGWHNFGQTRIICSVEERK